MIDMVLFFSGISLNRWLAFQVGILLLVYFVVEFGWGGGDRHR